MEFLQQQLNFKFWVQFILLIIIIVAFATVIVRGGREMHPKYLACTSKILKFCHIFPWIGFSIFVIVLVCQLPKYFRDMNRVLDNNYLQDIFLIQYINPGDDSSRSSITFVDQNDDEMQIRIKAHLDGIDEGDKYEILYLPYTRIGVIIRKIE